MYTLIRLRDGTIMEAVVLANKQSRMRLAVAGRKDAMELQLCGLDWFDERNEPVQFGFCWRTMTKPAKRQSWRGQPVGTPANREARL